MISGFFLQQTAKISFIEQLVANDVADARRGLDTLLRKGESSPRDLGFGGSLGNRPSLSKGDTGFRGLAILYSEFIGSSKDNILQFIDARALVPDKRGAVNLVVVQLAHKQKINTSYEEIREIISNKFDRSVWPWQILLFVIGVFVQVGTIAVTHFSKKLVPQKHDTAGQKNCGCSKQAENREPSEK